DAGNRARDGRAADDEAMHVNARMQVDAVPWLYAIGDVNGRALFTHMGKYQARIAVDCILGHDVVLSNGASWSARRSPAPTSRRCCTRRRSRSWARSRWTASATPSPAFRPAARSG